MAGEVVPAENASARTSWPCTASGFCRKRSFWESPVCTNSNPLAIAPRTTNPTVATTTGRFDTPRPSFPQTLREIASGDWNRGM